MLLRHVEFMKGAFSGIHRLLPLGPRLVTQRTNGMLLRGQSRLYWARMFPHQDDVHSSGSRPRYSTSHWSTIRGRPAATRTPRRPPGRRRFAFLHYCCRVIYGGCFPSFLRTARHTYINWNISSWSAVISIVTTCVVGIAVYFIDRNADGTTNTVRAFAQIVAETR